MRLLSFRHDGNDSYGAVVDDGVADLSARLGSKYPTLRSALVAGALGELYAAANSRDFMLSQITFRPVIPDPSKIICVGLNYHEHRQETGRDENAYPTLFARFPDSQQGHGEPLLKPRESDKFDYEGELAVIIGREGRRIPKDKAFDFIAGYSCYNDGSIRDWQRHSSQWIAGKNFVATGGFGPWMRTPDEVGDITQQTLVTRLNGREMQNSGIDLLIFDIPTLISYISTFTLLRPGDVVVTGTPGGVGFARKPPVYMKSGDICEVEISGVGTLRNPIALE